MIEFPFDTTRAVVNLVFNGTLDRFRRIRFILPHGGGTLPYLVTRIATGGGGGAPPMKEPFETYLRRIYCDTAGAASEHSFGSLLQLVDAHHVVYGSDWPYSPKAAVARWMSELSQNKLLMPAELRAIANGNATDLFPRLRSFIGSRWRTARWRLRGTRPCSGRSRTLDAIAKRERRLHPCGSRSYRNHRG
jgi:predicted TIM-barrel fold metal-dependent hydrolase